MIKILFLMFAVLGVYLLCGYFQVSSLTTGCLMAGTGILGALKKGK